jgi:hypothetical protein
MSEQATSSTIPNASGKKPQQSAASASDETALVVIEDENNETGSSADHLRRRRRRRRRSSLKDDGPERRIRAGLLILVVVLLILAITGAQAGSWLKSLLAQAKPLAQSTGITSGIKNIFRWEVFALLIAALILLYLQPGVEDKILRTLGIRKERKR